MDNLNAWFEQVSPLSLSSDVILTAICVAGLWLYIFKKGSKDILLLSLAIYLGRLLTGIFPWAVGGVGIIPGSGILFLAMVVISYWILHASPIGQSLGVSREPVWLNLFFGVTVVGLLLTSLVQYGSLGNSELSRLVTRSLFAGNSFRLIWTIMPLLLYPFLRLGGRK